MPRLPRYAPQIDVPSSVPYGQASGDAWAAPYAAAGAGLAGVSRTINEFVEDQQRLQKKKRESQQALEGFRLLMDARLGFDDVERAAKEQNDHASYEQTVTGGYQNVIGTAMGGTNDPEVQALLAKKLGELALEGRIKARTYATELYTGQGRAEMADKLTVARDMITGTADPRERARLTGLAEGAIRAQVGSLYKPEEAQKAIAAFKRDLQESQALVYMRTEPKATAEALMTGGAGYEQLPADTRARLAGQAMNIDEAQQRDVVRIAEKNEKQLQEQMKQDRVALVDQLELDAEKGQLSMTALEEHIRNRTVMGDDARRLKKMVRDWQAAGGQTDDDTFNRLELDILAQSRAVSRQEIRSLVPGKLAATGPRSAAALLKILDDAEAAKDVTKNELFQQGLKDINQVFRQGKGPLESLTGAENARLTVAMREYHDLARSGKFGMEQMPELARKIVDRLQTERPVQPFGDPAPLLKLRYSTPKDLLKAYQDGLIPPGEFNRQMGLMLQLGIIKHKDEMKGTQPSGRR